VAVRGNEIEIEDEIETETETFLMRLLFLQRPTPLPQHRLEGSVHAMEIVYAIHAVEIYAIHAIEAQAQKKIPTLFSHLQSPFQRHQAKIVVRSAQGCPCRVLRY
jgi:hypothetical protein